jgi:hypothetical protein
MLHFDALTITGLIAAISVAVFLVHTCMTQGCSRCDC